MAAVSTVILSLLYLGFSRSLAMETYPAPFLQNKLPLKVTVATPAVLGLGGSEPVRVSGRQAITAVFSRPIIKLGSDFGDDGFGGHVPFELSCKVPGKFRWVTTNIARFDPDIDWPTDLACNFTWNAELTSFDGASMELPTPSIRPLVTTPLTMDISSVISELASRHTADNWDATVGLESDKLPEVPPDGKLALSFNYEVDLALLSNSFRIEQEQKEGFVPTGIEVVASECQTVLRQPIFSIASRTAASSSIQETEVDRSCVQIKLSKGSLLPNTWYQACLPAGTAYNNVSGPLAAPLCVKFGGLRPFRFPFNTHLPAKNYWQQNPASRRLDLWLVHGLADGVTADQLASNLSLCRIEGDDCVQEEFNASLVNKGKLRLAAPGLQPDKQYRLACAGSEAILDGFGLPLQAGKEEFLMSTVTPVLTGPDVGGRVATLEGAAEPLDWPFVSYPGENQVKSFGYWAGFNTTERVMRALRVLAGAPFPEDKDLLGSLEVSQERPSSGGYHKQELKLDLAHGPVVVHTCCVEQWYPRRGWTSAGVTLVQQSSLQLAALATTSSLYLLVTRRDEPLPNVRVDIYSATWDGSVNQIGTAKTDVNGVALMESITSHDRLMAVVWEEEEPPVVLSDISLSWSSQPMVGAYQGALYLDRKLVRGGEKLRVSGYVRKQDSNLSLPGTLPIELVITPNFDPTKTQPMIVPTHTSAAFGSFHVSMELPKAPRFGQYFIGVRHAAPPLEDSMQEGVAGDPMPLIDVAPRLSTSSQSASTSSSRQAPDGLTKPLRSMPKPKRMPSDRGLRSAGGVAMADVGMSMSSPGDFGTPGFVGMGPSEEPQFVTESFTIADPRPPTVELKLSAPKWVRVNDSVEITADAISYLGSAISAASIDVTWRLPNGAQGVITLTTDAKGHASHSFDLTAIPNATEKVKEGNTLSLSAVWVGPTRERLTASADVQLSSGRFRIDPVTSLPPSLPGQQFGAGAKVVNLEDGNDVNDMEVTLRLAPAEEQREACSVPLPAPCTVTAGATDFSVCRLALPCTGHYVLSACTADGSCGKMSLGQNSTEWENSPWSGWPSELPLTLDKKEYGAGSTVRMAFEHPWPSSVGFMVWGSSSGRQTRPIKHSGPGLQDLSFPLGSECAHGCAVALVLNVPRDTREYVVSPYPAIPTSRLFAPAAGHTVTYQAIVVVEKVKPLDVEVKAPEELAPGASANITIHVKDREHVVPNAQITVLAVDRAVLDLLPYPLPQPGEAFAAQQWTQRFDVSSLDASTVQRQAVHDVFETLMRRLALDPWLPVQSSVRASYGLSPVDEADEQFLAKYSAEVTQFPSGFSLGYPSTRTKSLRGGGPLMQYAGEMASVAMVADVMPVPSALRAMPMLKSEMDTSASKTASPATSDMRLSSSFQATPLFYVTHTHADGHGTATFTAPSNLGKFVLRAFAATGSSNRFGSGETELRVARRVSLTAAAPRFVRIGDSFQAGVVVSLTGDLEDPAEVAIRASVVHGGVEMLGDTHSATTILTKDDTQNEVRFSFKASELGSVRISFTASGGGASDGLVIDLEVEGHSEPVTVATSFAVRATDGGEAKWAEGLELPQAQNKSGALNVTAAVGLFAAELALFNQMQQNNIRPYCGACLWPACDHSCKPPGPTAYWAVSTSLFPSLLSQYSQAAPAGAPAVVADAVKALAELTHYQFGLKYASPKLYNWGEVRSCDLWLNTWAVWLTQSYPLSATPLVSTHTDAWKRAIAGQLVRDAADTRSSKPPSRYSDFQTLAWAHLALGAGFDVPSQDKDIVSDLSFDRLLDGFGNQSLPTQTLIALAIHSSSTPTSPSPHGDKIKAAAQSTVSRLRMQGRTAYVALDEGAASAAGSEDQALSLLLLLASGEGGQLVQKLAAYVAGGRRGVGTMDAPIGDRATGVVLRALAKYDEASGNLQPSLTVTAAVGKMRVLDATFDNAADAPIEASAAWEALPSPLTKLEVTASGSGEASVGVVLSFTPAALLSFPLYRGLWVQRVVQLASPLDGSPTGPALTTAPLASMLAITLQVTTPDDLPGVTARVLLPAGLEPVDPNLAQDAAASPSCNIDSTDSHGGGWWWRWWPVCPAQETRPQTVTLSWQHMQAGTHSFRFLAVAASMGTFVDPSSRAFASQQPELMGMTPGGTFTVCDGEDCAAVAAESTAPPQDCPSDCNGNGACDISRGVCHCSPGWVGTDCATAGA